MRPAVPLLTLVLGCSGAPAPSGSPGAEPNSLGRVEAIPATPVAAPAAVVPSLRVASFNVNFGVAGSDANVRAIDETDADVVLLQETTADAEATFRRRLVDRYPHASFHQCCRAGGLGILSRHPIVEEEILDPVDWFPAARYVVDAPGGPVQFLVVHLRPPVSDDGSWVAGVSTTPKVRRREIETFWGERDPNLPTIVAGDFNENDHGRAIAFLEDAGLDSALARFAPHAKTWSWPVLGTHIHGRLDHVLYEASAFEAKAAFVLDAGASDHRPVVTVLARRADQSTEIVIPRTPMSTGNSLSNGS